MGPPRGTDRTACMLLVPVLEVIPERLLMMRRMRAPPCNCCCRAMLLRAVPTLLLVLITTCITCTAKKYTIHEPASMHSAQLCNVEK